MPPRPKRTRSPAPPELPRRKDGEIDGRSLRRTGRNVSFTVRVSDEFCEAIKEAAAKEGRTIGAILEDAFTRYVRRRAKPRRNLSLG